MLEALKMFDLRLIIFLPCQRRVGGTRDVGCDSRHPTLAALYAMLRSPPRHPFAIVPGKADGPSALSVGLL
jgi:hypothetical protein